MTELPSDTCPGTGDDLDTHRCFATMLTPVIHSGLGYWLPPTEVSHLQTTHPHTVQTMHAIHWYALSPSEARAWHQAVEHARTH